MQRGAVPPMTIEELATRLKFELVAVTLVEQTRVDSPSPMVKEVAVNSESSLIAVSLTSLIVGEVFPEKIVNKNVVEAV